MAEYGEGMLVSFSTQATHMRLIKPKVFDPSDWDELLPAVSASLGGEATPWTRPAAAHPTVIQAVTGI